MQLASIMTTTPNKKLCICDDSDATPPCRPLCYLRARIEAQVPSTENAPLEALLAELNVDSEHTPSNEGHRQKRGRPYRSSGEDPHLGDDKPFRSDKPPISNRIARTVAFFLFAVLVGVSATLVFEPYSNEIIQAFPPLAWLSPVSTTMAPVPPVTAADLQEQLKPLATDLALMRRSMEQLGSNLDQLARSQDQLAQQMATLQAAEQQVSQTASTPPSPLKAALPRPPKAVHAPLPPPKSLQPPAQ
jgi:hypothetical protein